MNTEKLTIQFEFTEPVLGLCSGNKEIHHDFQSSKAPNAEATAEEDSLIPPEPDEFNLEETERKAMTVFMRDDTGLCFLNYQVRGAFKEWISSLIELGEAPKSLNPWNYKRSVDRFLFVNPRRIYLYDLAGKPWKDAPAKNQRPLRGDTPRGERIALASSEELPPGTTMMFDVGWYVSNNSKAKLCVWNADVVRACMNFGSVSGFGQWRSGGYGQFTWKEVEA